MNRGQLRTDLRSRLQEEVADQWSDADLNLALLGGLRRLQTKIMAANRLAFLSIYTADIVDASSDPWRLRYYSWPAGTLYPLAVLRRASATAAYEILERAPYLAVMGRDTRSTIKWASFDDEFFTLDPYPTAAVAGGLQVQVVEHLSMAADSDVPRVALALHPAIVYLTKRHCLGETGENLSKDELADLKELLDDIPNLYGPGVANNLFVSPQVAKAY